MKAKPSRLLVIDACIASSATPKDHPLAQACKECLDTVLEVCHRAVFTEDLRAEWRRHGTLFAYSWMGAMFARRNKVERRERVVHHPVRAAITRLKLAPSKWEAVQKDLHLIDLALETDGTIISHDETARDLFRLIAATAPSIRHLIWVNPTREDERAIEWLQNGAPPDEPRRLTPL